MALEVAVHPAAAVDEEHGRDRVSAEPLGRRVETREQLALGAINLQVAHRSDVLVPAGHPLLAQQLGTGLGQGQGLRLRDPRELLQPQQQLHLRRELLSVEHDRAPDQGALHLGREAHRQPEQVGLETESEV